MRAAEARTLAVALYEGNGRPIAVRYFDRAPQETGKQGDPIKVKANDVTDLGELKIEPRKG